MCVGNHFFKLVLIRVVTLVSSGDELMDKSDALLLCDVLIHRVSEKRVVREGRLKGGKKE